MCPICGSMSCTDILLCAEEAKFKIEEIVQAEWEHGPFVLDCNNPPEINLAIVAGQLMRKWFGKK